MVPAPLRSIHRLLSVALLLAPLTLPAVAGAQQAPLPALTEPALTEPVLAEPMIADPISSSPIDVTVPATVAKPTVVAPAAPFAAAAVAGVHTTSTSADALARAEAVEPAALARRARSGFGHSQVLMIVGGAAVVLGLVTDGAASDFLLIGGAAVGLFGLYRYLQE